MDGHRTKCALYSIIISVPCAHTPKDGFETLCHVAADVSAAPSTRKVGRFGKICYDREYEVVLLVGLTELKAQIRWFDTTTVRIRDGLCCVAFTDFSVANAGNREQVVLHLSHFYHALN